MLEGEKFDCFCFLARSVLLVEAYYKVRVDAALFGASVTNRYKFVYNKIV